MYFNVKLKTTFGTFQR